MKKLICLKSLTMTLISDFYRVEAKAAQIIEIIEWCMTGNDFLINVMMT